jgi:hypothetical protein
MIGRWSPTSAYPWSPAYAEALGLADTRPTASELLQRVTLIANLRGGLSHEFRPLTASVLVHVVREVQEATWDKRVAVAERADRIARECCPTDYGELVGLALDLGLSQKPLAGGSLIDMLRALRPPVRDRLAQVASNLLRHVAEDCGVELLA